MPIEPVVTNLRQKLQVISTGTKKKFLSSFATIHNQWHMAEMMNGQGTFQGSPIGFLSFHHEVLKVYMAKYAPGLTPGLMAAALPPFRQTIDNAPDVVAFSNQIEDWHNSVHRNTAKYGANFANPRKNIYMKRFWEFHKFIDEKFQNWLQTHGQSYDNINHAVV